MPIENDLTPEEQAEFKAMETGTPVPQPTPTPTPEPTPEPTPTPTPEPTPTPTPEPTPELEAEAPKPGEPGSKHRADGTFKSAEELAADAAAITEAEAKAPKQQKMVPHQSLHEEREARKAAVQRAQLLETRMNQMLAARVAEPITATPMPDLTTNPVAYMTALQERQDQLEVERREQEQYQQIDNAFTQDEETFKQMQPDYEDAGAHYLQSRYAELSHFYPPQQIQQMLMNEVRQIAIQSWNAGRPAAATVYALAQARGYKLTESTPQPTPQPTPAPAPAPAPTAAAIVAAAAVGQQHSRSLSGGSGNTTQQLNAEAIANMSDDDFDEYLKAGTKGADARFAALFGA